MKKLDESGPQGPVIFVPINLINLPPVSQKHRISTTIQMNLAHNVSNLETQVSELMAGQQQLMEMMKTVHGVSDKQAPYKEDFPQTSGQRKTLSPPSKVIQVKQTFDSTVAVPTAPMDISRDQKKTHEWVKVQRSHDENRRKGKFGSSNSDHLDFKANPRRYAFVVFNAPHGCTLEKVK